MIKSELVTTLGARFGFSNRRDSERIVNLILDTISSALSRGERIELRGFGVFVVKRRPSRPGRNPRTGESVLIEEKLHVRFKAGKMLGDRLNSTAQSNGTNENVIL